MTKTITIEIPENRLTVSAKKVQLQLIFPLNVYDIITRKVLDFGANKNQNLLDLLQVDREFYFKVDEITELGTYELYELIKDGSPKVVANVSVVKKPTPKKTMTKTKPSEAVIVILPAEISNRQNDFESAIKEELMIDEVNGINIELAKRMQVKVSVFSSTELSDMLSRAFAVINALAQANPGDDVLALRPECAVLNARYNALPLTTLFDAG